jgi:hypothetical protein
VRESSFGMIKLPGTNRGLIVDIATDIVSQTFKSQGISSEKVLDEQ